MFNYQCVMGNEKRIKSQEARRKNFIVKLLDCCIAEWLVSHCDPALREW